MIPNDTTADPTPAGVEPAVQDSSCRLAADVLPPMMPTTTAPVDITPRPSLGLAMVARWFDDAGRARRRVYPTTASADGAVRRAARRGQRVEVELVELRPVVDGVVDLLDDGPARPTTRGGGR